MDTFISDLAETYIKKLPSQGEGFEFVEFIADVNQGNSIGMHSDGVSGKIIYQTNGDLRKSQPVFVKFVSTQDRAHNHRPFVVAMFEKEIHFYTEVVPFLNSLRPIDHLIPPFLHCNRDTRQGDTIAIMFRHLGPEWVGNNYKSFLDYAHLSLMMRKLGEFHAYSFAAKSQNEGQFSNLVSFRNNFRISIELFGPRMKETLRRSLQAIRDDQQYAEAVPRLEELIRNYHDVANKTYESPPQQQHCVLGHLSYNLSNVLFSYADRAPVDMKIMDWQSTAFVSLGVDLVGFLYADASQQTRAEYWDRLLDDYHDALRTTFDHLIVPSKAQVLEELKKAVGAAIFIVTYRASNLHRKTDSPDQSQALWNDEFVTEMLKDMIRRGFL